MNQGLVDLPAYNTETPNPIPQDAARRRQRGCKLQPKPLSARLLCEPKKQKCRSEWLESLLVWRVVPRPTARATKLPRAMPAAAHSPQVGEINAVGVVGLPVKRRCSWCLESPNNATIRMWTPVGIYSDTTRFIFSQMRTILSRFPLLCLSASASRSLVFSRLLAYSRSLARSLAVSLFLVLARALALSLAREHTPMYVWLWRGRSDATLHTTHRRRHAPSSTTNHR